jgi:hypothetical protein
MAAVGSAGGQARVSAVDGDRVLVLAVAGDLRTDSVYRCLAMM